jgi:precorrin-3B synthase
LAAAVRSAVAQQAFAGRLDPKVSIVIDGGAPLNIAAVAADIRLRAQVCDGDTVLRLAVGGDDATALDLGVIAIDDAADAVSRLLLVVADRGARARDIIATAGASGFADALTFARRPAAKRDDASSASRRSRDPIGLHALRDGRFAAGIGLAFGHTEATALEQLLDGAAAAGAHGLRTAPNRSLLAIGLTPESAARFFAAAAQLGFVRSADDPRRHVIACAGAPLCASAHIAARTMAPRLAVAVAPYLSDGVTVHISGCAKGCAHAGVAPLTVVGAPDRCGLIANGTARDAAFAAAAVDELPAVLVDHLRQWQAAERTSHRTSHV